jgi:predicted MFS family arabinose efflux permease
VAALTLGLSFGQEWGWTSWRLVATLAVTLAALAAVVPAERHATAPILDVHLLRNRVFVSANVSFMLCMLALFAVSYLLPFYFEQLCGFDTQTSGLLLTPLPLTLAVVAPISGPPAARSGTSSGPWSWLASGKACSSRPTRGRSWAPRRDRSKVKHPVSFRQGVSSGSA